MKRLEKNIFGVENIACNKLQHSRWKHLFGDISFQESKNTKKFSYIYLHRIFLESYFFLKSIAEPLVFHHIVTERQIKYSNSFYSKVVLYGLDV